MRLVLIRHGEAAEGGIDDRRPLTAGGRSEVSATASKLREAGITADRVLHSPKLRAVETAQIIASEIGGTLVEDRNIKPGSDPDLFVAELDDLEGTVAVVSHLPFLPSLIQKLTGETHRFSTADAFVLTNTGPTWTVEHHLQP